MAIIAKKAEKTIRKVSNGTETGVCNWLLLAASAWVGASYVQLVELVGDI